MVTAFMFLQFIQQVPVETALSLAAPWERNHPVDNWSQVASSFLQSEASWFKITEAICISQLLFLTKIFMAKK